jgi:hypothetical protein
MVRGGCSEWRPTSYSHLAPRFEPMEVKKFIR